MCSTPAALARASWCVRNGTPAAGTIGFGVCTVSGRSRVPLPPTRRIASLASVTAPSLLPAGAGPRFGWPVYADREEASRSAALQLRRTGPGRAELLVETDSWAFGCETVAVPGDDVEFGLRTLLVLAAATGDKRDLALGVAAEQTELPCRELGDGGDGGGGRVLRAVRPEYGDAHAVGVETEGVGPENGLRHASGAAFVDVPARVDGEVVAEVPPAAALDVVAVDTAQDGGRLGAGVVVAGGAVVDEGGLDGRGVGEGAFAQALVGAPALAGDDAGPRPHERLGTRRDDRLLLRLGLAQGGNLGGAQRSEVRVDRGALGGGHGEAREVRERARLRHRRGGRRDPGRRSDGGRGARGGGGFGARLFRVVARVDEFHLEAGGERSGVRGAAPRSGVLGTDAHLDAVRVADPERGRGTAHRARLALGAARVGGVVGVVRLQRLPAGPAGRAGRTGTDLDGAVELGVGVVPDHTDQGEAVGVAAQEAPGGVGVQGLGGFTGGPRECAGERPQGQ